MAEHPAPLQGTESATDAGMTVGRLSALSGVSVRTLHHYDEIGLLQPGSRTPGGYRLYAAADLARLRQILFYRELEFGLEQIAAILAEPAAVAEDHLRSQHRLLRERITRQQCLLQAIETEMKARDMGISLTAQEQFEVFGTDQVEDWSVEAEQRWGETDAYQQSQRRTATYTRQDWEQIRAEEQQNTLELAALLRAGEPADSPRVMDLAEAHRHHICRWFYDCGYDLHRGLGDMYVDDPRFTANIDTVTPGLAPYLREAIYANAQRVTS